MTTRLASLVEPRHFLRAFRQRKAFIPLPVEYVDAPRERGHRPREREVFFRRFRFRCFLRSLPMKGQGLLPEL